MDLEGKCFADMLQDTSYSGLILLINDVFIYLDTLSVTGGKGSLTAHNVYGALRGKQYWIILTFTRCDYYPLCEAYVEECCNHIVCLSVCLQKHWENYEHWCLNEHFIALHMMTLMWGYSYFK